MPRKRDPDGPAARRERRVQAQIEQDRLSRIAKDRAFIVQPNNWPRWPTLPMVRRDGDMHLESSTGILFAGDISAGEFVLYYGNMYRMNDVAGEIEAEIGKRPNWHQVLAKFNTRRFANVDELVAIYRVD